MKTPEEILKQANELAREFYAAQGYLVPEGYRFDKARHPQERACWRFAELAYARIEGTELSEILAEVEDE
jgi:hypothetical protein